MERARAEGLSADERAETRIVRVYSCYGADGTLLGKGTAAELKDKSSGHKPKTPIFSPLRLIMV